MKKYFVPYEESLELKNLGFDEECFGYYYPEAYSKETILMDSLREPNHTYYNEFPEKGDLVTVGKYNEHFVSAPLYAQAFSWFRDKHCLYASVIPTRSYVNDYRIMSHDYSRDVSKVSTNKENIDSYENTELYCLRKLIEIIKKKD